MEGLIQSFELAFRMQSEAPDLIDLSSESKATLDLYGIGEKETDEFGTPVPAGPAALRKPACASSRSLRAAGTITKRLVRVFPRSAST